MKRRVVTVALAIVLALVGTGLVLAYVNQANTRALAGQQAVTVLVAQQLIPAGTSASTAESQGLLHSQTLPAKSVPSNAVRSLTPALAGLVASADIQPGELLLRPMLVTAALASATGGIAVPAGMDAVTIELCLPEAVAGYIHPGSQVSVFDTSAPADAKSGGSTLTAAANCSGAHAQGAPKAKTVLVLAKAQVLSVGPASANVQTGSTTSTTTASSTAFNQSSSSSNQTGTLVTLAVTPDDAKRLILLTVTGLPYLALLN